MNEDITITFTKDQFTIVALAILAGEDIFSNPALQLNDIYNETCELLGGSLLSEGWVTEEEVNNYGR